MANNQPNTFRRALGAIALAAGTTALNRFRDKGQEFVKTKLSNLLSNLSSRNSVVKRRLRMGSAMPAPAGSRRSRRARDSLLRSSTPVPVAMGYSLSRRLPMIGNLQHVTCTSVMGTLYVGNNTLGATNGVYIRNKAGTHVATGGFWLTIGDVDTVGSTFIADITKHFQRVIFHRIIIGYTPTYNATNTSTAGTVAFAPRAGGDVNLASSWKTDNTAYTHSVNTVLSLTGSYEGPMYKSFDIDCTRWIRGGSGSGQNEFNIGGANATTGGSEPSYDASLTVPLVGYVTGAVTSGALAGLDAGRFHFTVDFSLVDCIGDFVQSIPFESPERKTSSSSSKYDDLVVVTRPGVIKTSETESIPGPPPLVRQVGYCAPPSTPSGGAQQRGAGGSSVRAPSADRRSTVVS